MVSPRYATAPPPAVAIPANSPNKSQKVFAQQSPAMQAPYNATVVGTGASPSTLTAQYSVVAANVAIAPAAPAPIPAPVGRPVHVQESNYDSWHPTEDDIIICTQNAFSDPHFKRTENWLNKAQEQANNSRKRARTATEARLRYTWLCTTGRTQQRLQDPQVIAQIAHLKSFLSARQASATANAGVGASAGAGVGASAGAAYNPGHPGVAGQAGTNVSNVSSPTLAHQQDNSPASNANS